MHGISSASIPDSSSSTSENAIAAGTGRRASRARPMKRTLLITASRMVGGGSRNRYQGSSMSRKRHMNRSPASGSRTPAEDSARRARGRSFGFHGRHERHGVEEGAEQRARSPVIGDLEELQEEVPRWPGAAGRFASRASCAGRVEEETSRLQ